MTRLRLGRTTCSGLTSASVVASLHGLHANGVYALLDMRPTADGMTLRTVDVAGVSHNLLLADTKGNAAARVELGFCPAALPQTIEIGLVFHPNTRSEAPTDYRFGVHDATQLVAILNDA